MTPDIGILTSLLNSFMGAFTNGIGFITGPANWLLGTLIVIDLLLAILLNLSDGDHMKTLITKILKYGLFIFLVSNYRSVVQVVFDSFQAIGLKAGGDGISNTLLSDPSNISQYGIWVTAPIFDFIGNLGTIDTIKNLPKISIAGITGLIIMLCFFIIGIQIFVTYLEFYIVGTLSLILIPFGVNKYTSFLGEKAIGALISFGIKLMVLAFVASVAIPLVKQWSIPENPSYEQMFCLLLGSLAITFLAWQAPSMAAGLLSGHPTLTAGSAAGFAIAGGAVAYGASTSSLAAIRAAANAGGQAVGSIKGGGPSGLGTLATNTIPSFGGIKDSFASGVSKGSSIATGGSSTEGETTPSRGVLTRPASEVAKNLRWVRNSVPPEADHGGGSAKPNLKSDT